MALTPAQLAVLKADIASYQLLNPLPMTNAAADQITGLYNADVSPDYWVWKPVLTEHEITDLVSVDGTTWSWTTYIARSQGERDAWVRMFNGTFSINPSLLQVRNAVADIFSGAGGAAQRAHLLSMSRRKASRAEKLFATGSGTTANPSTMGFAGKLTQDDVTTAREMT